MLTLFLTACFVFLGYLTYGLTGFGASIVALPLIVQFVPLKIAVALMLAMDLVAGFLFGLKKPKRHSISRGQAVNHLDDARHDTGRDPAGQGTGAAATGGARIVCGDAEFSGTENSIGPIHSDR